MIFWAAMVTGLVGSAHCVGMCGGLVAASAPTKVANLFYQLGRLMAYSCLGFIGGLIGRTLTVNMENPLLSLVPSVLMGLAFIWIGLGQSKKKLPKVSLPQWLQNLSHLGLSTTLSLKLPTKIKSFLVGLLSFLLPCGFLYGALLVSIGFQSPWTSMGVMAFFWLGTAPAMSFAPEFLRRILRPLQERSPMIVSVFFIALGIGTIAWRLSHLFVIEGGQSCH